MDFLLHIKKAPLAKNPKIKGGGSRKLHSLKSLPCVKGGVTALL